MSSSGGCINCFIKSKCNEYDEFCNRSSCHTTESQYNAIKCVRESLDEKFYNIKNNKKNYSS